MIYHFLFPAKYNDTRGSSLLLLLRILFGLLLMQHGLQKVMNFQELSQTFPDPIGLGVDVSLSLAIFAELVCSIGFIVGFLYRLALIPMIFTMCVVVFVVFGHQPFSAKELPFIYLSVFIILYITGPGKYSIDHFIGEKLTKRTK